MRTQVFAPTILPVSEAASVLAEQAQASVVQVSSQGRGQGAGVIWSDDGQVLTNHHVVAGARGPLRVTLADGRELPATLLASEPAFDLALLKVEASGLKAVPLGDSERLRVGELVFAVGHPWGQKNVVTAGIVSGVSAEVPEGGDRTVPTIRTDVRLRPGNSGGPLLNAAGAVVGINAMIFGGDLSIAIPSHVAATWIRGLAAARPALGVQVQAVSLPRATGDATAGLLVVGLTAGGTAATAGLLIGDVLLAAGDAPLATPGDLVRALGQSGTLRLRLLRGGAPHELDVRRG